MKPRPIPRTPRLLRAASLAAGLLAAPPAAAQAPPAQEQAAAQAPSAQEQAAAQALFDEARALTEAGKHAEACAKLAESQRLDPAIGTQFQLAECLATIGRTASAWSLFVQVADEADRTGQAPRARFARERAARLAGSLVKLSIVVPEALRALPDLRVERDGAVVGAAQWGSALPVDPGRHTVAVTAPGRQPWRHEVEASEPGKTVTVEVPPLAVAPAPPAAAGAGKAAAAPPLPSPVSPSPPAGEAPTSPQRVIGLVVAGAGLVAAGVGAGFGVLAMSKRDTSNDGPCDANDLCDPEGLRLRAETLDAARVSTFTFIGAGLAVAGGAVLFFTAPAASEPAPARAERRSVPRISVSIGLHGARVAGTFW